MSDEVKKSEHIKLVEPPAPESMGAPTRIAALGSPAATVEGPASAKPKSAQSDKSEARKQRLRAQRLVDLDGGGEHRAHLPR